MHEQDDLTPGPQMRVALPSLDYECTTCGRTGNLLAAMKVAWDLRSIKLAEADLDTRDLASATGPP